MTDQIASIKMVAVNIGNTNLSFALFEGRHLKWVRWMPVERAHRAAAAIAKVKDAHDVVIASVNPRCTNQLITAYRREAHNPVLLIGKEVPIPLVNRTDEPEKVGVDRLLNALAAHRRVQEAVIVVDVGTAITVDVVSKRGEFMGGLIAPGMRIGALALAKYTALLPYVEMRRPRGIYGKNTTDAIRSGIYWGTISMITGIADILRKRLGESTPVFITGGSAPILVPHLPQCFIYQPHLTLEGIQISYEACITP